jgi:3-deoxy-manno-octulosonate cytidylyltransferase (CMP-KDO synthetase)
MIQRVYERASEAKLLDRVWIATDDERILEACRGFGAPVFMSSPEHRSGTDRVADLARKTDAPIIINIQGDEPLLRGAMIDDLVLALQDGSAPMVSLMTRVDEVALIRDKNRVKVVVDKDNHALYFSRSPIPHQADDYFFQHIGIYGYRRDFLFEVVKLPLSRLERLENLEQLRALENGYRIKMVETPFKTLSVDSPQDIIKAEEILGKDSHD